MKHVKIGSLLLGTLCALAFTAQAYASQPAEPQGPLQKKGEEGFKQRHEPGASATTYGPSVAASTEVTKTVKIGDKEVQIKSKTMYLLRHKEGVAGMGLRNLDTSAIGQTIIDNVAKNPDFYKDFGSATAKQYSK
jgi:hypothetical protein